MQTIFMAMKLTIIFSIAEMYIEKAGTVQFVIL